MEQSFFINLFGVQDHLTLGQECARAVLIFFAYGLLMLRLSGRRTFGDWSAIDVILSIIIGSASAAVRAMTGNAPLPGTLAAAAVLTALHVAVGYLVASNKSLSRIVEGAPVELGANGRHQPRHTQALHDFRDCDIHEALRGQGVEDAKRHKAHHP